MVTGGEGMGGRLPWQADDVFQLPPREGWVFWPVGLSAAGWGEAAARVSGKENDDLTIAAVRALDERAMADGAAWGAGIWFPSADDHRPVAGLLVRTLPRRGGVDRELGVLRKQARKVPKVKGVTITSYDSDEGEVDLGRFVEQVIDSADRRTGEVVCRWRYTIFPEVKEEVVILDFDTVLVTHVDAIEDEIVALLEGAYYGVRSEDG